jgi:hypothetical protein
MSETALEVGARLDTHEAVCAERYKNLQMGIDDAKSGVASIKRVLLWVGGALFTQVLVVTTFLLFNHLPTMGH